MCIFRMQMDFDSPLPNTNEVKLMDFNFMKMWKIQICMFAKKYCKQWKWRWFHFQSSDFLCKWYHRSVTKCRGVGGIAPFSGGSCFIALYILFPVKMLTKNSVLLITDCLVTERSMDVGLRRKRDLFFLVILGRFLGHPLNGRQNCLFVRPWKGISFSKYRN